MKNSKTRGATKVPNVKLRPAQASSSRSVKGHTSPSRVARDDDAAQCELDLTAGNKPFRGLVLCATGNLDKRKLFAHAQELGAIRANDFTDKVTHLVADTPGSAKYKCAVERHLPILKESWVEEAYQTWLNGEVVNLEQTIIDHRLPIFSGVRLCLAGTDDLKTRGKIHSLLAKENGVYLNSLDKATTHLLLCSSGENPLVNRVIDYNKTQTQSGGIHLVWEEWFWDSLEFGGRWDEHEYQVANPRPSRKSFPQTTRNDNDRPTVTFSSRTPLPSSVPTSSLLGDDPPEYGSVNKVPQARQIFYSNIFQGRERDKFSQGTQSPDMATGPVLGHHPSENNQTGSVECRPKTLNSPGHESGSSSVLTRLASHRVTSFGHTPQAQRRQPFRRIISATIDAKCSTIAKDSQESPLRGASSTSRTAITSNLFTGYTFRAFGEANGANLRDALEAHSGRWLTEEDDDEADFLIVRLVSGGMYWREERDNTERAKYRTECWLESCMFEERICAAQEHVAFTPLKVDTSIIGSEKLRLSLSGLDTAEACWIKRLIRALGANLLPTFSRHSTHLICPSRCGAKFEKAVEWGVNVVDTEWLIKIATSGEIPDATTLIYREEKDSEMDANAKQDVKGKFRQSDEEMIVDITNGCSQNSELAKRPHSSSTPTSSKPKQQALATSGTPRLTPLASTSDRTGTLHVMSPPESNITFGQPTDLLSATPLPSLILRPPSSPRPSSSPRREKHTCRRLSAVEVEQDKQITLIPSSHSPSPLKIRSNLASASSPPVSETHGLRTAITALLGKRSTTDRDEADVPTQKRPRRPSKRPRPSPSRARAKTDLDPRRGPSPASSLLSGSPPLSRLPVSEEMYGIPEEGHASLRVVYEDPGQRAEKRRLIALFEGATTSDVSKTGDKDGSGPGNSRYDKSTVVAGARPGPKRRSGRKSAKTPAS